MTFFLLVADQVRRDRYSVFHLYILAYLSGIVNGFFVEGFEGSSATPPRFGKIFGL